jgi:pimeloyl-ACP methyl ester carboxylesterase
MGNRRQLTRRAFGGGLLAIASVRLAAQGAPVAPDLDFVTSPDGTRIAFNWLGDGPPIVFSHESLESGAEWLGVAKLLADRHRCFVVDRRGRGASGPAGRHSLERECEDLEAVLDVAGPRAALLGASYGAVVAIESALRRPPERLVLYEPPLVLDASSPIWRALQSSQDEYRRLTEAGALDEALVLGLEVFAAVPSDTVKEIRQSSPEAWRTMRDLTPTWVPEMQAIRNLTMGVERYRSLRTPTLLVTGTQSPPFLREAITALDDAIPLSRVRELADQGHEAHLTAPALLADAVATFLAT